VRSELIFRAKETVDNKYKLCQTASKATRRLHIAATNTTDTINDAFSRIAGGDDSSIGESYSCVVVAGIIGKLVPLSSRC
jgi:hypothetical protein